MKNPSARRSEFIWNKILVPYSYLIAGIVEISTTQNYTNSNRNNQTSRIGKLLKTTAWLPNSNSEWLKPSELALEDLPEDFYRNHEVAAQLGMRQSHITALAADNGVEAGLIQGMLEFIKDNPDAARTFLQTQKKPNTVHNESKSGSSTKGTLISTNPDTNIVNLAKAFIAPGNMNVSDEHETDRPVNNPARYREKLAEHNKLSRDSEPPNGQRTKLKQRRVWEDNKKEIRDFFKNTYNGKCQITGETFPKRAGGNYFEVWYILSTQEGEWLDDPGNALCVCPEIWAKLEYGAKSADFEKLLELIPSWICQAEGGAGKFQLPFELCGEPVEITFSEAHMLRLQDLFKEIPDVT